MLKAIKIQIYPNTNQVNYINNLLGCSRFVYNKCLDYKIQSYNNDKINKRFKETSIYLTNLKQEFNWLKDVHSKVLQQSLINLEDAYKRFFINGDGFPNFKKRSNLQTCRFPKDGISRKPFTQNNSKITICKQLKNIIFKCSSKDKEYLNKNYTLIKSATLSKTKDNKYFLSILIERENTKTLPNTKNVIGIDLGIKDFIITSNKTCFENIKIKRNNEKKLTKLHKQLSKKQKGSNNRNKARIKLAKFYNKLNNKKEYYLHSVVNKLLNENQVIVMEDLNVKGMMKNQKLAKSIQELSLHKFKTILEYKAKWYGRDIIHIDRFFPSTKLCNVCNTKNNNLTLNDREWTCNNCNTYHNRDYNASINIKNEGLRILKIGRNTTELTLVESNSSEPQRNKNQIHKNYVVMQSLD